MPTDQQEQSKHIQHSPPSNYSVSCFQLKDLLSWTTKNLRCFFFSSICLSNLPLNPQTEQFQNAVTKFHVPENMPQHQKYSERCFCLESHSTRFSVRQRQQPGKQQPHLLLVLSDMSLAAVTLWWHGELVDQKCVNGLRGPAVFKEGKKTQELRRTVHVWGLLKQW